METATGHGRIRPVEVLASVMCVAAMVALLLPACHSSRHESMRRTDCTRNLKNISFGLQTYHDIYGMYPMGAMHAGDRKNPRIGPSWWYAILPYCEQRIIYDRISRTQTAGYEPGGIEFTYASMPNTEPDHIQTSLRKIVPDYMRCPSSFLPVMEYGDFQDSRFITMPSYVGIAGGCDIDPDSADYNLCPSKPHSRDIYVNDKKGTGPNGSIVTSSGLLPPMEHIRISDCEDGLSHTMIVGEQSGWLGRVDATVRTKFHGDSGWNTKTDVNPGGWLSGTTAVDPVGPAASGGRPGRWKTDLLFNLTTVRMRPQRICVLASAGEAALPGCAEVMGHNNPLQSPHYTSCQFAFADGSVHAVTAFTDLTVLLRLAVRNDGVTVDLK